jgi:hypothetical protein
VVYSPLPWPTAIINTPAKSGEDKLGEDTQYYYVTSKLSLSPSMDLVTEQGKKEMGSHLNTRYHL